MRLRLVSLCMRLCSCMHLAMAAGSSGTEVLPWKTGLAVLVALLYSAKKCRVGLSTFNVQLRSRTVSFASALPFMVQPNTQTQAAVGAYNKDAPSQALVIIRNAEVPRPGHGEVLVHVNIRPVNPSDIFWFVQVACLAMQMIMTSRMLSIPTLSSPLHSLQGVYGGFKPSKLPAVPGLEGEVLCPDNQLTGSLLYDEFNTGLALVLLPPQPVLVRKSAAWLDNKKCTSCVGPEQRALRAGAGLIEQLGEGVTDWKEGERVTAVPWPSEHGQGTWQVCAVLQLCYRPVF